MKEFNVTGTCIPSEHYMVDISKKLDEIICLIEKGKYFTINRARQYGKTTTLAALHRRLKEKYLVIRLSFEGVGEQAFSSDFAFVKYFIQSIYDYLEWIGESDSLISSWKSLDEMEQRDPFDCLSKKITDLCIVSSKEILLMIDEVDKSSDNQIFLNFLGMLRNKYLRRQEGLDKTFKSVILAGIYDVKNLKLKIRPDAEKKYNSPWNVAADFGVDMSFSATEIASMLKDYESEHHTGMNIDEISGVLYFYTSGYPVLVSRLCKWIDEEGQQKWTEQNVQNAEKAIMRTRNTLFDDLIKNIENNQELRELIIRILYDGYEQGFYLADPVVELGVMHGIFKEHEHRVVISNLIFETYLYDYIISIKGRELFAGRLEKNQFVMDGRLNMPYILEKFQEVMRAEYREADEHFIERQGRLLFLCFLKPIINGTGFYYVEPETRSSTRMDIVVVYGGEEFIIELKIWHGKKYREQGIQQLAAYLDSRNQFRGYLVSFSFQKKNKVCGWVSDVKSEKQIFEIVV